MSESVKEYKAKAHFWFNCKHYPKGKAFSGKPADIDHLLKADLIEEGKGHDEPSWQESMHRKPAPAVKKGA